MTANQQYRECNIIMCNYNFRKKDLCNLLEKIPYYYQLFDRNDNISKEITRYICWA